MKKWGCYSRQGKYQNEEGVEPETKVNFRKELEQIKMERIRSIYGTEIIDL